MGIKVGVSGHQSREGIDWAWVSQSITKELSHEKQAIDRTLTSLAVGSDQVFALACLNLEIPVVAVLPMSDYESKFADIDISKYRHLLERCSQIVDLPGCQDEQDSYWHAGKYIADHCDVLFAIWDGKKANGKGGTGDVVEYARGIGRSILHFDPINCRISKIPL